uniref:Citrate synthase n=1 Tax=Strombidinopsis acuminata TaxID=141414 RepID=A0A7S3TLM9_9SPIT
MDRIVRIAKHVAPCSSSPTNDMLELRPTSSTSPIMDTLKGKIAALAKTRSALKAELLKVGDTKIQDLTVEMAINGARGIKAMVTETSDLDAQTGITYRGMSLFEVNKALPKAPGGESGLPEASFWLLLTGEVPSDSECKAFTEELHRRSSIPQNVLATLAGLPKETHPMTQLSIAMLALQKDSIFAKKYNEGMKKAEYWEWALEDAVDLVAKIPVVAAVIYSNTFKDGKMPAYDDTLDWAGNYAQMLGVNSGEGFKECTRLYLMLHADHEGGNVSAHTCHLVGSALSDPYYSWAAGLCGLAGPLHGLANQECLGWLLEVQKELGDQKPTKELLVAYVEKTMKAGKVVPGFGHAVLRQTDPRYMLEREFALKHCKDDPLFHLVDACYQAIPPTLEKSGKVKNPFPNVDAHSGQLMYYYNLKQENYYTVLFSVSRAIGVMSQYVWSRALGLPIERPKSVPLDVLAKAALKK